MLAPEGFSQEKNDGRQYLEQGLHEIVVCP